MIGGSTSRRAFSMTEMIVVIAIIIVLLGLLFPALAGVRSTGQMTKSMAKLRQIGTWMTLYSTDNRDFIVPSRFNYANMTYPGKTRNELDPLTRSGFIGQPGGGACGQHCGTWTDILWTLYVGHTFPEAMSELDYDYATDSPDENLHRLMGDALDDPFRSEAPNSNNAKLTTSGGGPSIGLPNPGPTPFGDGAQEAGLPGYFAANDYFATSGSVGFKQAGQIKVPARSMYAVDSFAGEIIDDTPEAFLVTLDPPELDPRTGAAKPGPCQVDFRYNDMCLMLFLDAHVEAVAPWDNICDLEGLGTQEIRIRNLQTRRPACQ